MNSKFISLLLISCLLVPACMTYSYLQLQKRQVKKEVKKLLISGIDREDLVLLKFTDEEMKSQLQWEHSKEFKFKGEMFDVVERNIVGDTTYFWCWWDYKETKLCKLLDQLTNYAVGNLPEQRDHQERLYSFFKSLFITEPLISLDIAITPKKKRIFEVHEYFTSTIIVPPAPPPKFV
ncbi:MAG: hypothetical protein IPM92_04310 [Saprospiraceae bacterium]|nr:hypothetical protein [Saprospiraceae bacterium]